MRIIKWLVIALVVIGGYLYRHRDELGIKAEAVAPRPDVQVDEKTQLELPRLSERSTDYLVVHRLKDGSVNYTLEYDSERHHARWVAFTFDDRNSQKQAKRSDAWAWDPQLPESLNTEYAFKGSGYSRGHLVASEDRVASHEANVQTFYYSNMSPQLQEHNAGVWAKLENKVQAWGRDASLRRVLYVTKGGTITDGQILPERVKGKIVVPKYYWMALVSERDGVYHGIAFWTEHRTYSRAESNLQHLAISIDELEQRTGLDLFCNLPDELEVQVEAERPDSREARRHWWR